jgi:hypothetical protein
LRWVGVNSKHWVQPCPFSDNSMIVGEFRLNRPKELSRSVYVQRLIDDKLELIDNELRRQLFEYLDQIVDVNDRLLLIKRIC